jgi:hypothetical protein
VGCGKPISQETFCAEHYPMFKGSAQAHNAATASMVCHSFAIGTIVIG